MGPTARSRTAQGVAVERAVLHRLGALDDPHARALLAPSMAAVTAVAERLPRRTWARAVTLAGLTARVRWFDEQVAAAADAGIDQVAIVGAGYDSRAWRCARPGLRFVELDQPATQQDKVRRAPEGGPAYVAADVRSDDVGAALHRGGIDPGRPALFAVEGVTMYLDEDVVRGLLGALARAAGPGSRLAVDVYPARAATAAPQARQARLQRLARAGSGEGFRYRADRADAVALVAAAGWRVDAPVGLRDAARRLVPPAAGLAVDAIDDGKTLLAATLP